ncbi:hypothetical protein [Streptomyces sp. NPDC096311]|uniref:hypothetical protein n=1 Tax=Streptomyces sp. NPDC096311 TaxID=3366083 RepID=UPI003821B305
MSRDAGSLAMQTKRDESTESAQLLQEELRSLERRAQSARKNQGKAWSRNTATQKSGLPKQTVSGWFSTSRPRIPKSSDELWRLVITYSTWANENPQRGFWNNLWEEARNSAAKTKPSSLGQKISERVNPFDLDIHRSIDSGASKLGLPSLPIYIQRPHDNELKDIVAAAAEGSSRIAVLVGESSTGKTRACWESIQRLPNDWSLWHPINPTPPEALTRGLENGIPPKTVLWLNETQLYLDTPASESGERVAAGLRELLRDSDSSPVLILGTVWPDHWDELTRSPHRRSNDRHPQARSLLSDHSISVPSSFSASALKFLKARMGSDPRLADSYAQAEGGQARVTQFLAGAPAQMERYRNAPDAFKAIVDAAIDLRRLGKSPMLPSQLLCDMAALTMERDVFSGLPDDWFQEGIAYALAQCKGASGPLARVRPLPDVPLPTEPTYRLSDYIEQVGRTARATLSPPPSFAVIILRHIKNAEELKSIASSLHDRGRNFYAAQLYLRASELGDYESAHNLARILEFAGDRTGAAKIIEACYLSGDPKGSEFLAYYLYRSGEEEKAEALCLEEFDNGNYKPWIRLEEAYELAENIAGYEQLEGRILSRKFPEIIAVVKSANFNETRRDAIRSAAKRLDSSEAEVEILFDEELEAATPRLELIVRALETKTHHLRESLEKLKKFHREWSTSENTQKAKAAMEEIAELQRNGDYAGAKRLTIQGLNAGIVGIEKLGQIFSEQGEGDLGESIERQGIDWAGNAASPWGLQEVRSACESAIGQ